MHRHLTSVCALIILILCTLTLTFSTHAKRTFYTAQYPSPVNVALPSSNSVASAFSIPSSGHFPVAVWQSAGAADDVVWVEDALPAGAIADGSFEGWNWTSSNPSPFSGTLAHTSGIVSGVHQHYFYNATQTLTVNAGDTLIAYIFLDPANPPTAVMLQFSDGSFEHRAYWGANQFDFWGVDGTVSRRNMGALPPTGQWVRLEVPASSVGLEGRTLNGMAFSLFNGRATWDRAGKHTGTPVISISDVSVNEGNSGTTSAVFNVTLSSASTQTISVNYATANGTASSPSDYAAASSTLTFAPGQTSKPISIPVVGDTTGELNESFFVNLSGAVNATLADNQGIAAILNDDAQPSISDVVWVEDATPAGATVMGHFEGWNWTSSNPAPFSGTLAHTSDLVAGVHQHLFFNTPQTLTVNVGDTLIAYIFLDPANPPTAVMLQFSDGSFEHRAYWGANQFDFWGTDGTVSRRNMGALPPTGQWVRLEVPASLVGLEGRTLNGMAFSLFNGRAVWDRAGKYAAAPVIPAISISDVSVNEGNSGNTFAAFNVTLSSASTQTISVSYATANGTATSPSDYAGASGTLVFAPGQTSQPLAIPVIGDTVVEANENFFLNLSNPVNATLEDNQGVGTILNDDAPPTISISDASVNEGNSGVTSAVFNVTLSSASQQTISVDCATANGTASNTSDYVPASGPLTFNSGQTSISITIQVVGDTVVEANENFFVNCSNPVNATLGDGQGVGTILNDDVPSISISDATVNEGNSGNTSAVFNVTLSSVSTQTISVNCATASGTASSSSDYVGVCDKVTFAPGQTSRPISIQVVGDTAVEANENFFVNLSNPVNATLADNQGVGTILNDDVPSMSISDVSMNEGNSGNTSAVFNVTLSSASTQTISVNYATANGTAISPSDYLGASSTLTLTPGQTSKPITIPVVGETAIESNENFFVNLSGAVNATLADSQGVGTILNDDTFSFFEIPVYFHVIQDTNGDGFVAESRLNEQINVLNNAFDGATAAANVRFFFWKAGVTRDTNHDWFNMEHNSLVEMEAKRMLRQGGANALNFYITRGGSPPAGSPYRIGWGAFPHDYAGDSCRDGVVVPFTTLPGDSTPGNPFNAGDLPVHEVGHWLGLIHTFQGSCSNLDEVDDTPAHLNQFIGECPAESTDSCPSSPGTDPVHNFMTNYSDACKSEFTRGQFERMRDQYLTFRSQFSTPVQCPVATVAWVEPAELTWGQPNTLTVAGHAFNGSGGVELYWRDVTETPVLPISPTFNRVEWQPTPNPTDHSWSNTIPSPNKWHTFEVYVVYSGYESRRFLFNGSTARYYELVARHTGKCADVEGESTAAGARLIQFGCGGWANQQFQVIPIDTRYNKIVARHSGKVLYVQGGGLDNGTPVLQWDENGTTAQQWEIIYVGDGYFKIVARHSGKVLDVAGAFTADLTQIHQWDYVGIANQQWLLRSVP